MDWETRRASMLDLTLYSGPRINDPYCDVTIVTRKRNVRAHRNVLAPSCHYFSEVLSNGAETVTLGDIYPDVVMYCLTYIYSGVAYFPPFNELDEETALQIHYLAGMKLRLINLLHAFYDYLIQNLTSRQGATAGPVILLFVLRICRAVQDVDLTARMKAHIVKNLKVIFGSRSRNARDRLGLKDLLFVLTAMEDWTEEADMYKWRAIIHWIRACEATGHLPFEDLIKKVEYANLDADFVWVKVLTDSLFHAFPKARHHIIATWKPTGHGISTRRWPISDIVVCNPETTLIRQWDTEEGWFNVYHAPMFPSKFLEVTSHRGKIYVGNGDEMWIFNGLSWLQVYPKSTSKPNTGRYNQIIGCGEYVAMVTCRYVMVYNTTTLRHAELPVDLAGEGFFAASSGKRKIFVMGGSNTEDAFVQIDLKRERFKNLKPMTNFRDRGTAFYMDKTVVVFARFTRLTKCYDVKRKKWDTLHFNWKIEGNTKAFVIGRILYIYGIDTGRVKHHIIDLPVEEFLEQRATK